MFFTKTIIGALVFVVFVLLIFVNQIPDNNLHIITCNVGEGDAILVTYKNIQILTDGGPDNKVEDCLSRHLPYWDREIELIISTHPDADHSSGLIGVTERFRVDNFMSNPINPGTQIYQLLINKVGSYHIPVINPYDGLNLRLGLIYLNILNPNGSLLSGLNKEVGDSKMGKYAPVEKTNVYSIVNKISFKKFTAILPGDIDPEGSDRIATENTTGQVDYIKISHHGSKNGTTINFLKSFMPKFAVISVGKNNYGHPDPGVLEMLKSFGIKTLRTDEMGDVEVVTDGEKMWVR